VTLQAVRKVLEDAVKAGAGAVTPAVPVYVDNQQYTDNDATKEFVLVRVNFGTTTEPTFCENVESLRGSLVVEIFTPKGKGPGRGQTLATEIAKQLNGLRYHAATGAKARMLEINGPSFSALDGRPHYMTRLSGPLLASYT
jgi:Bacteriophage related domain of unknown function